MKSPLKCETRVNSNGWTRITIEIDYKTCPDSRKYFRISWHGREHFTNAQALTVPNASEGEAGGAWFLCANQTTIQDHLRSVSLKGTGRLDDYRVASYGGPQPKQNQTIDFDPIADQIVTNVLGLAATASSGLPVSFTVTEGPAAITNGTTMFFTGSGHASVRATQAGNDDWNPAAPVAHDFDIFTEEGFLDANSNNVDDAWEEFYYGEDNPPDTFVRQGGTVMTLREVFVAGLNPHDDSLFEIVAMDSMDDTEDEMFILTFPAATDRVYSVLANNTLTNAASWTILTNNIAPTGTTMQIEIPYDTQSPQRFYRIKVSLP